MKRFWFALVLLGLLAACGGSDNHERWPAFPSSPTTTDSTVNGNLSTSDVLAPDGSYADFYILTVTVPTTLNVRLESDAFDAYLFLFDAAALYQPDLALWDPYWLAENDDADDLYFDAAFTYDLAPGSYLIVVNSFDPASIGSYTLRTQSGRVLPTYQYLQYRTYEDGVSDRYQAWIEFRRNGALLQENDLLYGRLFDGANGEVLPATTPQFYATEYISAVWDSINSQFTQISQSGYSGLAFDLSNQAAILPGYYSFWVMPAAGDPLGEVLEMPSTLALPTVLSATMDYAWNMNGSLTLSWVNPGGSFDNLQIVFYDQNGRERFIGSVAPGVTQVTLSAALVQTITQNANLVTPTSLNWRMQTRSYFNTMNYARGYSDPVPINW